MTFLKKRNAFMLLSVLVVLAGCEKQLSENSATVTQDYSLESRKIENYHYEGKLYALTKDQYIIEYDANYLNREVFTAAIHGLQTGEEILAIDMRPATGQLYGVSNQSRLYLIHPANGKAVAISMTPFTPAISGTMVGFDFNPTVDRIRMVTSMDQNLRLHPETGAVVATDGNLNSAGAGISSVAYTNSFAGAATTILYDISNTDDMLYRQIPPNDGKLVPVGKLGINVEGESGFDISSDNSFALAVFSQASGYGVKKRFYSIDLNTGQTKIVGNSRRNIIGIALATTPVAYAVDVNNNLLVFNPFKKGDVTQKAITGLAMGEQILGIDIRPATGQLYALVNTSKLYTINTISGAATLISATPFATPLSGSSFGFDFNPTVDRIRVISNTGQNLRLHPVTGVIAAVDPALNPGSPVVDAAAYTNSYAGAITTILYDIDIQTDKMFKQDPANAGTLVPVGGLGIKASASNGFDISSISNKGYGIFKSYDKTYLLEFNLNVGYAQRIIRDLNYDVRGFTIGLGL